jgi:hypothetical protein
VDFYIPSTNLWFKRIRTDCSGVTFKLRDLKCMFVIRTYVILCRILEGDVSVCSKSEFIKLYQVLATETRLNETHI